MKVYADDGPKNLPGEVLKVEGRHNGTLIFAFREGTIRLYGGQVPDEQLFLVTELDDKKRRKADMACLQRAATILANFSQGRSKGAKR